LVEGLVVALQDDIDELFLGNGPAEGLDVLLNLRVHLGVADGDAALLAGQLDDAVVDQVLGALGPEAGDEVLAEVLPGDRDVAVDVRDHAPVVVRFWGTRERPAALPLGPLGEGVRGAVPAPEEGQGGHPDDETPHSHLAPGRPAGPDAL